MVKKKITEEDILRSIEEGMPKKPRPKVRFGSVHRTQRVKYTFYFVLLGLVVLVGTCRLLTVYDWSAVGRREAIKHFLQAEATIAKMPYPYDQRVLRLMAKCNTMLRDRWMTGYFYSYDTKREGFIGRIPRPEFKQAIDAQKGRIKAGQPVDEKQIPRYRFTIDFPLLRCRVVAAEMPEEKI